MATHGWEIGLTVLGLLLTVITGLIAWYLRSINSSLITISTRIDEQDEKINALEKTYLLCKQNCQQEFVTAEQFVRNESYTRQKLDAIANGVSILSGQMKIIEQMPNIAGQIASNIVKEMKG